MMHVTAGALPSKMDVIHAQKLVYLKTTEKGTGVFALTNIPADTYIGLYPGRLYTRRAYENALGRGEASLKYGMDMWMVVPRGSNGAYTFYKPGTWFIDPSTADGLRPEYAHAVTPYINEPSKGQRPNVRMVYNIPKHSVEFWTSRSIKKDDELTMCYGSKYGRNYDTPCSKNNINEDEEYVIYDAGQTVPVPLGTQSSRYRTKRLEAALKAFVSRMSANTRAMYQNLSGPAKKRRWAQNNTTSSNSYGSNGPGTGSNGPGNGSNGPGTGSNGGSSGFSSGVSRINRPTTPNYPTWLQKMHILLDTIPLTESAVRQIKELVQTKNRRPQKKITRS